MTPRALHPFSSPGDMVVHSHVQAMVKKVTCPLATRYIAEGLLFLLLLDLMTAVQPGPHLSIASKMPYDIVKLEVHGVNLSFVLLPPLLSLWRRKLCMWNNSMEFPSGLLGTNAEPTRGQQLCIWSCSWCMSVRPWLLLFRYKPIAVLVWEFSSHTEFRAMPSQRTSRLRSWAQFGPASSGSACKPEQRPLLLTAEKRNIRETFERSDSALITRTWEDHTRWSYVQIIES